MIRILVRQIIYKPIGPFYDEIGERLFRLVLLGIWKMSSVHHQGVGKGMTLMTSFVPNKWAGALVYNIVGTSKHDVITAADVATFRRWWLIKIRLTFENGVLSIKIKENQTENSGNQHTKLLPNVICPFT